MKVPWSPLARGYKGENSKISLYREALGGPDHHVLGISIPSRNKVTPYN